MEIMNFDSKEVRSSRNSYVIYSALEYFVCILVSDAFLATLLEKIGMSDSLIGLISSFISLAFLFQLLSVVILKRKIHAKALCMVFETASQLCFGFLYVIPFLPVSNSTKSLLVVIAMILAYALKYVVSSILFRWTNSYVSPMHRGSFSAVKESISLGSGIVFTFIMGFVSDKFFEAGNSKGAFAFIAVSIFILTASNLVCLLKIKNCDINSAQSAKVPMKTVMQKTILNKRFLPVIIATSIYSFGAYITIGFLGVYKTKDLLISLSIVSVINGISSLVRMAISKPFGKYSDRKSYAKGIELGYLFYAVAFLIIMFTVPKTWWLMILYSVLYSIGTAGVNANTVNVVYSYVEADYISQAMAFRSSISGILGFVGALVGAKIMDAVQASENMVFGMHLYPQQLMAFVSFVCVIISVTIIHFVVSKNKVTIQ